MTEAPFTLERFLPYLLNQAAEAASLSFQEVYAARGMTRTQWRVLANLGEFGAMTARDICARSHIEKTKVSRAVAALEEGGLLRRAPSPIDRRAELLSLTSEGRTVFEELGRRALEHDRLLRERLGEPEAARLEALLKGVIAAAAQNRGED